MKIRLLCISLLGIITATMYSAEEKIAETVTSLAKQQQIKPIIKETELETAIYHIMEALNKPKPTQEFGNLLRAILSEQNIFSGKWIFSGNWISIEALLAEILKSDFEHDNIIASLCEAELATLDRSSLERTPDRNLLTFVHSQMHKLNRQNKWFNYVRETIENAYTHDKEHALLRLKDYVDYLFKKPENESKYVVYALVREIMDSNYIIHKDFILQYIRSLSFLKDKPIQQLITKYIPYPRARNSFQSLIKLSHHNDFGTMKPEQMYFQVLKILSTLSGSQEWETLRPIIEELFDNKFFSHQLMIIFALETASDKGFIKELSNSWTIEQIRKIQTSQKLEKIDEIVGIAYKLACMGDIEHNTHQMASQSPILKTKLNEILQEHALDVPFMYGLVKTLLSSMQSSCNSFNCAACLGIIGDYYSENNIRNTFYDEEGYSLDFGAWLRKRIDSIDPIAYLQKVQPKFLANLPVELTLFKDSVRSLFNIPQLAHLSREDETHFKAIRMVGIGRALGFGYLFNLPNTVEQQKDLRYMPKFTITQSYFYLTDPYKKDQNWSVCLPAALQSYYGGWQELLEAAVSHYKIHLMPKEDEAEKMAADLMREIKSDKTLQDNIIIFKVLFDPEDELATHGAPRIVICVTGRAKAQIVLNKIIELFGPGGRYKYESSGRKPMYNQEVSDLIFFAQGDRDDKRNPEYDEWYTLSKIYYRSTIFKSGPPRDFTLKYKP